jgi:hypothetical protein
LIHIIELSDNYLDLGNLEIEVEYQGSTIGKYGLDFNGTNFLLTSKQTACLAEDKCGLPDEKPKVKLSELNKNTANSCCTPNTGCC